MKRPGSDRSLFRANWGDVVIIAILVVAALLGRGCAIVNL